MFRRGVSLIVMLGFVTGQLGALPHAHGEIGEPFDHNCRPHVHVSWFVHVGQCHDSGRTHHHQADGTHSHLPACETTTEHDGHDSDAIYLSNDIRISLPIKSVASFDSLQVGSTLVVAAVPTPMAISECLADAYAPDKCCAGCPLYLALRALRI
jgi:hypothetical protein